MLNKIIILIFGNIKLAIIKLFHFRHLKYSLYNNISPYSMLEINKNGIIVFGRKLIIKRNSRIAVSGGKIAIGANCGINSNCYIVSHENITIGNNVIIGPNVVIVDHDHTFDETGVNSKMFKTKSITINDGVWIGANCVILKGVTIGKNAIIAAGSIVNHDIPENTILIQKKENKLVSIK